MYEYCSCHMNIKICINDHAIDLPDYIYNKNKKKLRNLRIFNQILMILIKNLHLMSTSFFDTSESSPLCFFLGLWERTSLRPSASSSLSENSSSQAILFSEALMLIRSSGFSLSSSSLSLSIASSGMAAKWIEEKLKFKISYL